MKYISIILMSLFLVGNANADTRTIQIIPSKKFDVYKGGGQLICIDTYKFVYTLMRAGPSWTSTMTQFFEDKDCKSLPAKC